VYYLVIFLCCLFLIDTVRRPRLRESPRVWRSRPWAVASGWARQVTLSHIDPMCSLSFSSIHIGLYALILNLGLILRIWVHTWLVMLSHAVMSVVQVLSSFEMLSLACILVRDGLPSIEMWFDHGEDRCYDLSKDGLVETVGLRQVMWLVMLKSAKEWILGVDPPGQHVPPRVRYGTSYLLIWYDVGCVSCSVEWGWLLSLWSVFVTSFLNYMNHMVQEGPLCVRNLSTASEDHLSGNLSKAWRTPVIDLYNSM
jgi:hypothetical protein